MNYFEFAKDDARQQFEQDSEYAIYAMIRRRSKQASLDDMLDTFGKKAVEFEKHFRDDQVLGEITKAGVPRCGICESTDKILKWHGNKLWLCANCENKADFILNHVSEELKDSLQSDEDLCDLCQERESRQDLKRGKDSDGKELVVCGECWAQYPWAV